MDQFISAIGPLAAAIAIVLFALPSFVGLIRQKGFVKALIAVAVISLVILGTQALAIQFNYPFGDFGFGDALGYKLLGIVPWTVAFAYTPIVLAIFWLASKLTRNAGRVLLGGFFLAAANVVLDPALAFMGLRSWENGGPFFGVPVINFAGWFVCGLILTWILHRIWGNEEDETVRRSIAYSGFAIIWFWGGVNLGLKQWIPAGIGIAIGLLFLVLMYVERRREAKAEK
jgi:putative membrane protein